MARWAAHALHSRKPSQRTLRWQGQLVLCIPDIGRFYISNHIHTALQVRNVNAKDAAALMKSGWVMLDVRPPNEVKKARVVGAVEVSALMMVGHRAF